MTSDQRAAAEAIRPHLGVLARREIIKTRIREAGERRGPAREAWIQAIYERQSSSAIVGLRQAYFVADDEVNELKLYLGFWKMVRENLIDGGPEETAYL